LDVHKATVCVPLAAEAGVDPKAKWFIAEGADAPHLTRSMLAEESLGPR
jgi:sulfane dehydrogenase subunit SoxC